MQGGTMPDIEHPSPPFPIGNLHSDGIDSACRDKFACRQRDVGCGKTQETPHAMAASYHSCQAVRSAQELISPSHIALREQSADDAAAHLFAGKRTGQHHLDACLTSPSAVFGEGAAAAPKPMVVSHEQDSHMKFIGKHFTHQLLRTNTGRLRRELQHVHLIFGPVDGAQIEPLNQFCMQHNIRLVMPFAHTQGEANQPLAYTATAPSNVSATAAAALVQKTMEKKANYVILNTNEPDTRGALFTGKLKECLAEKKVAARVLNIDGDDFAYESAFNQTQVNCIIPDNTGIKSLNILCTKLRDFAAAHPQYRIRLVGYPEWMTYTETLLDCFYQFDTYAYCTYYSHPLSPSTQSFDNAFDSNFGHPMMMSFPRYAMMGFDMGYYFMHGLAALGDTFEAKQGKIKQQPAQHNFLFQQDAEGGERMNLFVQLVHYSTDQKITLVQ